MLLDRIDIDAHGPLHRVELGPFAEHLNVVCAPVGSGKTAIARFVRDTLVDRQYPVGMLSSSTGRVVWADRGGMVHCHREQDGTTQGRRRIQFESRGDIDPEFGQVENAWLQGIGSSSTASRACDSIQLSESIVDGVITDTAVTSVARVVSACLRNGLDSPDLYHPLPMADNSVDSTDDETHRQYRAELADVEAELARVGHLAVDYEALVARRNELTSQLAHPTRSKHPYRDWQSESDYAHWQQSLTELHDRARELRSRQSELRRWITEVQRDMDSPVGQRRTKSPISGSAFDRHALSRERSASQRELDRVTSELDTCLAEAAELRRSMGYPGSGHTHLPWMDREAMVAELRRIDDRLASMSRTQWLKTRRNWLREQLQGAYRSCESGSPLAGSASRWLVRLTAGRLNQISWPAHPLPDAESCHQDSHLRTDIQINGRDEAEYTSADRAIAAIAVRMAAGDVLSRSGQHVPLVIETHPEMCADRGCAATQDAGTDAYHHHGEYYRHNHPLATALRDYTRQGRQVLVLTSDRDLTAELARADARTFEIHPQRIVHPHRPVWRSRSESEKYVGQHPHVGRYRDAYDTAGRAARGHDAEPADVNRDFDMAWREAYETDQHVAAAKGRRSTSAVATDSAPSGAAYRDGYYFADAFTTVSPRSSETAAETNSSASAKGCQATSASQLGADNVQSLAKPRSPFLLSVDSPIDQAPSIDAVAAARLRGLNITHVNHLMRQDSNRLADALCLASVDAATIRRWQAESRLCCRVPKLRNFDARILVGCGITSPEQLAATHPVDLLRQVECFLATDRGQQILRSGSSHELARITTWIATANSAAEATVSGHVAEGQGVDQRQRQASQRRRRIIRTMNERDSASNRAAKHTVRSGRHSAPRPAAEAARSSERSGSSRRRRGSRSQRRERHETGPARSGSTRRYVSAERSEDQGVVPYEQSSQRELQFYLDRESPVVDSPSIGSRMGEKLNEIGIYTVDDLLQADPETTATELDHRKVDADTVLQWQQQATFVCRVPMLRGHDAQLLVAAEVTTPEELAACDAEELLEWINPIVQSSQGRRIIRGGNSPDLEEVTDWIGFAQHTRELKAA